MIIKVTGSNTTIPMFYDRIALAQGLPVSDSVQYDCRKINVAKNIQDNIFDYYKNQGANPIEVSMMWLNWGPKVDESLKQDEVELADGWYMNV